MKISPLVCLALLACGCGEASSVEVTSTMSSQTQTEAKAEAQTEPRVEVGLVKWNRNLDEAKALARKTSKPILLTFQEIPG